MPNNLFPPEFLWAASTSAYQFEGSFPSDGKGLSIQDKKKNRNPALDIACDHIHHIEEDVALLKELGLKAYRFSISWSRILPLGRGKINEQGLAFYAKLIGLLVKSDIAPIVTMMHDDLPWALEQEGGWSNRQTIEAFKEYCAILYEHFGDQVQFWQPICEQNLLTIEKIATKEGSLKEIFQQNHHMFLAHAHAVSLLHKMKLKGKIGPALNLVSVYPATSNPLDVLAAQNMALIRNWFYLDVLMKGEYPALMVEHLKTMHAMPDFEPNDLAVLKAGCCDMISFSNYTSATVMASQGSSFQDDTGLKYGFNMQGLFQIVKNPHLGQTEFDWEVDPIGTRLILMDVFQRYQKPIFIIERSLGENEVLDEEDEIKDDRRIRYLQLQIEELKKVILSGVKLIGFCTWSAFDLVSTGNGMKKRYGLIYVDRDDENPKDCRRVCKKSYAWYKQVIASQGNNLK